VSLFSLQVIDSHFSMPNEACAPGAAKTAPKAITAAAITKRLTIQYLLVTLVSDNAAPAWRVNFSH
jgi:hypothetical protein